MENDKRVLGPYPSDGTARPGQVAEINEAGEVTAIHGCWIKDFNIGVREDRRLWSRIKGFFTRSIYMVATGTWEATFEAEGE